MKECMLFNYERRYKITMKQLLAAVVGIETVDRHMATLTKERKVWEQRLNQTKTFTFGGISKRIK